MSLKSFSQVRALLAVTAAAVAIASGCGSSQPAASNTSTPASAVPSGALFYADVNLDQGSDAWQQFAAVGRRFPGWQHLANSFLNSFQSDRSGTNFASLSPAGITFKDDIQPWLGDSAGIAVTSIDSSGDGANYVAFVASKDDAKAVAAFTGDGATKDGDYNGYTQLVSKDGQDEIGVGDGAVLVASDAQTLHDAIDTRDGKGDSLADDGHFTDAMDALPSDSLARGYVNTQKIAQLVGFASLGSLGQAGSAQQFQQIAKNLQSLDSASFAFWANEGGFRFTARATLADGADQSLLGQNLEPSTLTRLVPSDAFAYLAFSGYDKLLEGNLDANGMQQQLRQLEQQTGLSVKHDLLPLLSGQALFYAAPGVPFRGALILKPDDPDAAAAAMHKLTALVARMSPGLVVQPLASGDGETLSMPNGLAVVWHRSDDGLIAIGNDQAAGSLPQTSLVGSDAFAQVLAKAGAPSDANVPFYLNVTDLLKLFPVQVDANLEHLGAVLAWSSRDGNSVSFDLFAEVK